MTDLPPIPKLLKQAFPTAPLKESVGAEKPSQHVVQCLIGNLWLITGKWDAFDKTEPLLTMGRMVRRWDDDGAGKFIEDRQLIPKTPSQLAGWISMCHFKILEEACRYLLDATHPDNFLPHSPADRNKTSCAIEAIRQMGIPDEAAERIHRTLPWVIRQDKRGHNIRLCNVFTGGGRFGSHKKEPLGAIIVRRNEDETFECGIKLGTRKNRYSYPANFTWADAIIEAEHAYTRCSVGFIAHLSAEDDLVKPS